MSVRTYSKTNDKKYFADFFKKGFIIPTILLSLIFTTFLAMMNQFDFFEQLTTKNNKLFALIFILFYLACLIVYSALSIKSDKINMGDSVCVSFILATLLYLSYLIFYSKSAPFTVENLIILISFGMFGVVLTLLNYVYYNEFEGDKKTICYKRGIKTYYSFINKKYKFFGIIIASIIINCLFYVGLNLKFDFVNILAKDGVDASKYFFEAIKALIIVDSTVKNYVYLILLSIGVVFLLVYALISAFDKELNSLDLFLTAFFVNIPVLASMIYFLDNNSLEKNAIIVGAFLLFVIVLSIFRYCFFNQSFKTENSKNGYYKNLFANKEILMEIGIIALIVLFSNISANLNILSVFTQEDKQLYFYVGLLPYAIIYVACCLGFFAYAFGLIKVIINLGNKSFQKTDRFVVFNLTFGLFNLAIELIIPIFFDKSININVKNVVIFATYTFVSLGIMLMRKHSVK